MRAIMGKIATVAALLSIAAAGWGSMGSIISSFRVSGYAEPYSLGIYAGPGFVSAIMNGSSQDYLYRYNKAGSLVATFPINGTGAPRGGDKSHLGGGYLSLVDATSSRLFLIRSNGVVVSSFPVTAGGGGTLANVMWTGTYYEVAGFSSRGVFNRYRQGGASAGSVSYNGWPAAMTSTGAVAYSRWANGRSGSYLIASSRSQAEPSCILNISGSGSLVATFTMPPIAAAGGCCGPASVSSFGTTYWVNWGTSSDIVFYEVDIVGRNTTTLMPASLGKVKAIYR